MDCRLPTANRQLPTAIVFLTTKARLRRTSQRGPSGLHKGPQRLNRINRQRLFLNRPIQYIVQSYESPNPDRYRVLMYIGFIKYIKCIARFDMDCRLPTANRQLPTAIVFLTTKARLRRTSQRGPSGLHKGPQRLNRINRQRLFINRPIFYIVQSPKSPNPNGYRGYKGIGIRLFCYCRYIMFISI